MPLTKTGEGVMRSMKKRYGPKKGKSVFYASVNANKPGSEKWHESLAREIVNSLLELGEDLQPTTLQAYWDDAIPGWEGGFTDRLRKPTLKGKVAIELAPGRAFIATRVARDSATGQFRLQFDVSDGQIIRKMFAPDTPAFTVGGQAQAPAIVPSELAYSMGMPKRAPEARSIDRELTHTLE